MDAIEQMLHTSNLEMCVNGSRHLLAQVVDGGLTINHERIAQFSPAHRKRADLLLFAAAAAVAGHPSHPAAEVSGLKQSNSELASWLAKTIQLSEQQFIGGDDKPLSTAWKHLAEGAGKILLQHDHSLEDCRHLCAYCKSVGGPGPGSCVSV
jgi:hypothetical protein